MGKIKAIRRDERRQAEIVQTDRRTFRPREEDVTMIARFTGAFVRMVLVMLLISLPSMLLESDADTRQIIALLALFAGGLVLVEYGALYPSLIEFRDAPPFNRLRFAMLFVTVAILSLIARGEVAPSLLSSLLRHLGETLGRAIDFPFSPVRLVAGAVSAGVPPEHLDRVRAAAGISYLVSLISLVIFVMLMRSGRWPGRGTSFNVWVNLPTFDPTAGRDVVYRLERDARVNILLGFMLPFLIPLGVAQAAGSLPPVTLLDPQMLIWGIAAWCFLPASLFMRGIAMNRIAAMIREQRRLADTAGAGRRFVPA